MEAAVAANLLVDGGTAGSRSNGSRSGHSSSSFTAELGLDTTSVLGVPLAEPAQFVQARFREYNFSHRLYLDHPKLQFKLIQKDFIQDHLVSTSSRWTSNSERASELELKFCTRWWRFWIFSVWTRHRFRNGVIHVVEVAMVVTVFPIVRIIVDRGCRRWRRRGWCPRRRRLLIVGALLSQIDDGVNLRDRQLLHVFGAVLEEIRRGGSSGSALGRWLRMHVVHYERPVQRPNGPKRNKTSQ